MCGALNMLKEATSLFFLLNIQMCTFNYFIVLYARMNFSILKRIQSAISFGSKVIVPSLSLSLLEFKEVTSQNFK